MTLKEKLIEACGKLNEKNEFKVGDLVEWKEGMKNRNLPEYGEAVIITAVPPGLLSLDYTDGGTPYELEPRDIKIGVFHESGDFLEFAYDSRRFKPYGS